MGDDLNSAIAGIRPISYWIKGLISGLIPAIYSDKVVSHGFTGLGLELGLGYRICVYHQHAERAGLPARIHFL